MIGEPRDVCRARVVSFDNRYGRNDIVALAVTRMANAMNGMPLSPFDKAIAAACFAGGVSLMMDDAFAHPQVQECIWQMDEVGPILRASARLFDALYESGRN